MQLYTGFDLHSSNSYVGIIDEHGKRAFNKKLPNDPVVIIDTLRPFRNDITDIAVESTYNRYWLVDLLMAEGDKVHLANPSAIQKYSGLKYSDDRHDAFWLAEMMRLGILPEGYIYPKEDRPIRDLLRKRSHLVRLRTSLIISLQNIVSRNNGIKLKVGDVKALKTDRVAPLLADNDDLALAGKVSKETIDFLTRKIKAIVYLAWAFSEAAEFARRLHDESRTYYNRKMQKTNFMTAHNALAHKLARAAYYIMRDHVPFMPEKLFAS